MSVTRIQRMAVVLVGIFSASTPFAQPKAVKGVFTDNRGMRIYWWDNDTPGSGKSGCNHACAATWPPYVAAPDSGIPCFAHGHAPLAQLAIAPWSPLLPCVAA